MENFSKVLRQLPEGARKWLLQDCMVNGIPTQFEDLKSGQCEYYYYDLKFEIVGGYISLCGNMIYDILKDEPLLKPVKWQDPTPEQVKAIYEGVKEAKCVFDDSVVTINLESVSHDSRKDFFAHSKSIGRIYVYIKGKGFALPISWKEEEEKPEQKEDEITKLFDLTQELQQKVYLLTAENEAIKKIFKSKTEDLTERVTKLEQKEQPVKEQHAPKEVESGDLVTKLVEFYMWMQRNGFYHNVRSRVEKKAHKFLETTPSPTKER